MMPTLATKISCPVSCKAHPAKAQKGKPIRRKADQPKPQSAIMSQWQRTEKRDNLKNEQERRWDTQTMKAHRNGNSKRDCRTSSTAVPMNYAAKLVINIESSCVSFNSPLPRFSHCPFPPHDGAPVRRILSLSGGASLTPNLYGAVIGAV